MLARAYQAFAADIKILPMSALDSLQKEAQSPEFGQFLKIFGIFQAVRFRTSL